MPRFVFADEAGDFEFARKPNVSKYFIACTIALADCTIAHRVLDLRRRLILSGESVGDYLHASEDKQAVRDAVYDLLQGKRFTIHATILEKSKAQPQIRPSKERFYKHAWYFHFSGVSNRLSTGTDHVMITTASAGTRKGQGVFTAAINDVARQRFAGVKRTTHFCPSMADPCLQVVDYCAWAIQRKWERGDRRSYDLIRPMIQHEHETWQWGTTHFY